MERASGWIAQVYGYAVCLICVVIILISTHSIIDSTFDYANPMSSGMVGRYGEPYAVYGPGAARITSSAVPMDGLSARDSAARAEFKAQRQEQIDRARFGALRSLVSAIAMLLIATVLFLLHWRWIRRATSGAAAA